MQLERINGLTGYRFSLSSTEQVQEWHTFDVSLIVYNSCLKQEYKFEKLSVTYR